MFDVGHNWLLWESGRFAGFRPAASDKSVRRMSETVASWHLRSRANLPCEELEWDGPRPGAPAGDR
jgi:hypothetical protein